MATVFVVLGVGLLVIAFASARAPDSRLVRCARSRLVLVPLALVLLPAFAVAHAAGYLAAVMLSHGLAVLLAALEIGCLLGAAALAVRRPSARALARRTAISVLFAGSLLYVGLVTWLWRPPSEAACSSSSRPGTVDLLTPPELPGELSDPYDILYVPQRQLVLVTFKSAGNGTLDFWLEPAGNRFFVIDVADPDRPRHASIPLPGPALPQYMTWDPARQEVVLSRLGYGKHSLAVVGVGDFPNLHLARSVPIDYEPHSMILSPDGRSVGCFKVQCALVMHDRETFQPQGEIEVPGGMVVLDAWQAPGAARVYVSMMGPSVAELDLGTGAVRLAAVPFGGGQLTAVPERRQIFETDIVRHAINVIDMDGMSLVRTVGLDYTPRSVRADVARDLLLVTDWFGGRLVLYRLSTLAELASTPVAPHLRNIAYDSERGLVFATSKCGVMQVRVDAITGR